MTNTLSTKKTVLILGSSGRFGRAAALAFDKAGWIVRAQIRAGKNRDEEAPGITFPIDLNNISEMENAASGCAVIVNALNPPDYTTWETDLPKITTTTLKLAVSSGATVMMPGNVYNFGENMPAKLTSTTPQIAKTKKGRIRIEMENAYREASTKGVKTVILRIGDFLENRSTGNWFDTHMTAKLKKGTFLYPGPTDQVHAWGYLPDAARAMVALAENRNNLPAFADIPFPGTNLTGEGLRAAIEHALQRPIKTKSFPWGVIRVLAIVMPGMRELLEMRYLWNVPHALASEELKQAAPGYKPTPLETIMHDILQNHGATEKTPAPLIGHTSAT